MRAKVLPLILITLTITTLLLITGLAYDSGSSSRQRTLSDPVSRPRSESETATSSLIKSVVTDSTTSPRPSSKSSTKSTTQSTPGSTCPVSTQNCVPCNKGELYCRVVTGQTTGYKGWACQNNNPGNIRYSDYRNSLIVGQGGTAACGQRETYMVFRDYATGRNGLRSYIKAINTTQHTAYPECGNCNLKYFFSKYAPSSDNNNPDAYAIAVASEIGVDPDTTMLSSIVASKLEQFIDAIQRHEGWFVQ